MGPILGLSSFILAFGLHVAIWRVAPPSKPYKALVLVWIGAFVVTLAIATLWFGWPAISAVIYGAILGAALIVCYAIVYTGIEHDSPTLSIVNEINRLGEAGLPVDAIESFSQSHPFVRKRLDQLIADGIVRRRSGNSLETLGNVGLLIELSVAYREWTGRTGSHG